MEGLRREDSNLSQPAAYCEVSSFKLLIQKSEMKYDLGIILWATRIGSGISVFVIVFAFLFDNKLLVVEQSKGCTGMKVKSYLKGSTDLHIQELQFEITKVLDICAKIV